MLKTSMSATEGKPMTQLRRDLEQHTVPFPPGLGPENLTTAVPGLEIDRGLRQQGDLLFLKLDEPPAGKLRWNPTMRLAVNRDTGASHTATGDVAVWELLDDKGEPVADILLLEVGDGGAKIVHDGSGGHQHAAMALERGWHRVGAVRETNPFAAPGNQVRAAD
jgi:hypothetical protein